MHITRYLLPNGMMLDAHIKERYIGVHGQTRLALTDTSGTVSHFDVSDLVVTGCVVCGRDSQGLICKHCVMNYADAPLGTEMRSFTVEELDDMRKGMGVIQ